MFLRLKKEAIGAILSITNFVIIHYTFENFILKSIGKGIVFALDSYDTVFKPEHSIKEDLSSWFDNSLFKKAITKNFFEFKESSKNSESLVDYSVNYLIPITFNSLIKGWCVSGLLYSARYIPIIGSGFKIIYNTINLPAQITEVFEGTVDLVSSKIDMSSLAQESTIWYASKIIFHALHDKIDLLQHLGLVVKPIRDSLPATNSTQLIGEESNIYLEEDACNLS